MNLKDRLKEKIDNTDLERIPRAFDILGNIAVIEIPEGFEKYEKIIADEVMDMQKNVRTVAKRTSITSGVERIRKVKVIAGEKTTETIYKENGLRLKLDINSVFFSPRLGNERLRIESKVGDGETVIDMFCGIGPFSILIAKRHPNSKLYAVDINREAIEYLRENMKINKVENIIPFDSDIRDVAKDIGKIGDRLIMNLPRSSLEYIDLVPELAKPGAVVHVYCLLKDEIVEDTRSFIKNKFPRSEIEDVVACAEFGPGINIYCIDFKYGI